MPYLRFGKAAPLGRLLAPMFEANQFFDKLHTVYENTMAGALRIRAQAGDGLSWLPRSLVEPDLANGLLFQTRNQT